MSEKHSSEHENQMRVLNDPEVLRLIADPLRLRILELLRQEPRTVTELAELLGIARTRLYYHVRLLETHDLVTVAETHVVAGITEKRYRVTAYRLSVDKSLLGGPDGDQAPLETYLSVVLDEVATEIRRAVAAGLIDFDRTGGDTIQPRRMMVGRNWYWFTDEQVEEFSKRYAEFYELFEDQAHSSPADVGAQLGPPDAKLYEWLIGFYPVVPPDTGGEDLT